MDPYGFLGKGWKFPIQIDKRTGHIATVEYEEDIHEAIGIILNTYMGERVMRKSFGTRIPDYMFRPLRSGALDDMGAEVQRLLQIQEPRIKDVEVKTIELSDPQNGRAAFQISYTVRSTNNRNNHVYPFYMDEGNREESII